MAVWTREINTNFNFPNIDIINIYKDGVLNGYEARPQEGYVMYSLSEVGTFDVMNPETGEITHETPYFVLIGIPLTFNFDNFDYVAVLRDTINEDLIQGGGDDNDHEVM
jgi:hypothetical protein